MIDQADQVAAPVRADERSALLDSLRGYALFGILTANMLTFMGLLFIGEAQAAALPLAQFNALSGFLLEWLVIGKFYSIFSLLFGIGFAIQLRRLEQRGEAVSRYLRRLAILFLIGLAHLLLLWIGDILALYALMGAILLLFRRASDRTIVGWVILLWLIPVLWSAAIQFGGVQPSGPIYGAAMALFSAAGVDASQGPLALYMEPDLLTHLRAHPGEVLLRIALLVDQMRFTKVLGMFLIGLWVGRRAIHADLDRYRPLLGRVTIIGLGAGLPLAAAKAVLIMRSDASPATQFAAELLYVLSTPTLALGYAAGFALLWRSGWKLDWAAPAGRMALTNYLMQTIIQSVIFLGWGLGLMGTLGLVFVFPLSVAIFALQIAYSRWWLSRYRFGPVEWLWRSLTYGKRQPMRTCTEPAAV